MTVTVVIKLRLCIVTLPVLVCDCWSVVDVAGQLDVGYIIITRLDPSE